MINIFKLILLIFSISVKATTYYVSNAGSNLNAGTSPSTSWATISRVNTQTLVAGDSVLFKCGDTWRNEGIEVDQSGTVNAFITYSSYGTGAKPRILGSVLSISWVTTGVTNVWRSTTTTVDPWTIITAAGTNCQVFFIETNGDVTWGYHRTYVNLSELTTNYDWTWYNNNVYIYSTIDPNTAYTGVECPQRQYAVQVNHVEYITFNNLELAYLGGYGIRDAYGPATLSGQRVTNCHIHHIGRKGSNVAYGTYTYHSDSYYGYNDIHDCGRRNISIAAVSFPTSMIVDSVIVENNYLHGGYHTTGVDVNPSSASASPHIIQNVFIRNNLIEGDSSQYLRGGDRADILYNDGLLSNGMFLANQNGLGTGHLRNLYIYNNIFTFAAGKSITLEFTENSYVYNNTFYKSNHTIGNVQGFIYVSEGGGVPSNINIRNNIIYNDAPFSDGVAFVSIKADANWIDSVKSDYNLFWAEDTNETIIWNQTRYLEDSTYQGDSYDISEWTIYQDVMGWDTNSPNPSNPLFTNFANDLSVSTGSSAIGAGDPISWITTDYYGNPRDPVNPTLGAIEFGSIDSTGNHIIDFTIPNQLSSTIDTTAHTVAVVMPYGTDRSSLTPTIVLSYGATINPLSGVTRNFTNAVTYTVTSLNATQQVWTVTITINNVSTATEILTFTIPNQTSSTVNATNHTVTVLMPYGTNLTNLTPTIIVSAGATISPLSGVSRNFTSPITYTVTAEDGITQQIWTITINTATQNPTVPLRGNIYLLKDPTGNLLKVNN